MFPDHVYIIISSQFEPDRLLYMTNYFTKYSLGIPISFFEAIYKNRDEHKLDKNRYSDTLYPGEKCLTQTYINLFRYITMKTTHNNVLILESDCLFQEDFREKFTAVMKDYEKIATGRDMILFGNACKLVPKLCNHRIGNLYLQNISNCTDSMFMNIETVKSILEYLDNNFITKPIDHLLNDIIPNMNINSYWCIPELVTQGSAIGKYKSTVR